MTLDAVTGKQVGSTLTGSATATDVSSHILAFESDHTYVLLHTHPNSTSFSDRDVRLLAEHAAIRTMVAVGVDGTWYVMSQSDESTLTYAQTVQSDYLRELDRLRQARVPIAERPHLVMEYLVARHGWLYDRVTGISDESAHP